MQLLLINQTKQMNLVLLVILLIGLGLINSACFGNIISQKEKIPEGEVCFPATHNVQDSETKIQSLLAYDFTLEQRENRRVSFQVLPLNQGISINSLSNFYDLTPIYYGKKDRSMHALSRYNSEGLFQGVFCFNDLLKVQTTYDEMYALMIDSVVSDEEGNVYCHGKTDKRMIFGHRVPKGKEYFALSISNNNKIQWISFFDFPPLYLYFDANTLFLHQKRLYYSGIYQASDEKDIFRLFCLDPGTGNQLWFKDTPLNEELEHTTICYTSHGIHLSSKKAHNNQDALIFCVRTFSYEGDLLWEKELLLPQSYDQSFKRFSCSSFQISSSKDQLFFALTFQDKDWKNKSSNYQEFFQLWSLSPEGTLLWDYASTPDQEVRIRAMVADDQLLYLAGTTSTDYLKPEQSTFQPARAGERDLFLLAIDRMGQQVWNSYLGGSNEEDPEVGRFMDADSSRPFSSVFLRVQGDRLVLAGTTYSQDFPVHQRDMRHFNPIETASADSQQDSLAPAYAVMSVWDTQGQLQWSSYLSTDATTEQLEATPASTFQIKTPHQIQEWIWDVTIDGKKIYILSDTNNPHTLLYRTQRDRVKVVQKQGYDRLTFQLLSILDLE
jgi:outer membrane protein assembly factor BamB